MKFDKGNGQKSRPDREGKSVEDELTRIDNFGDQEPGGIPSMPTLKPK